MIVKAENGSIRSVVTIYKSEKLTKIKIWDHEIVNTICVQRHLNSSVICWKFGSRTAGKISHELFCLLVSFLIFKIERC